jgi:thiaminase
MSTNTVLRGNNLSFAENIERNVLPVRQAILAHPFITGVGDGTLDVEKFKYYVRQDYAYLIDYSRVLALASARAPDLETIPAAGRDAKRRDGLAPQLLR